MAKKKKSLFKKGLELLKKYKIDILYLIVLLLITGYFWKGVLGQTIEGEGYYYFSPTNSLFSPNGDMVNLLNTFDNFPRIGTHILEQIFKGNIQGYMNFIYIGILFVSVTIYITIRAITKSPLIAFLSSLYAATSYTGNFQFYARGHYQWFMQRVPQIIPTFISLIYLDKYISSFKQKYYLISLLLFIIAILMSHYTTLTLPLPMAYLFFSAILATKDFNKRRAYILRIIPLFIVNYYFIKTTSLSSDVIRPNQTFWGFLTGTNDLLEKIYHQFVVSSIPFYILKYISQQSRTEYRQLIQQLVPFVYSYYFICLFIMWRRKAAMFRLAVSLFVALHGYMFLVVYLNRVNVFNEIEQGRYYYVPAIYVGTMLSLFMYYILIYNRKYSVRILSICILSLFFLSRIITNYTYISKRIHDSQYFFTAQRIFFNFLEKRKNEIPENSYLFMPNPPGPSTVDFLKKYYSGTNTTFIYLDKNWKEKIPVNTDINKIFFYDFNKEMQKGGRADISNISILDLSENYRREFVEYLKLVNKQKKM